MKQVEGMSTNRFRKGYQRILDMLSEALGNYHLQELDGNEDAMEYWLIRVHALCDAGVVFWEDEDAAH